MKDSQPKKSKKTAKEKSKASLFLLIVLFVGIGLLSLFNFDIYQRTLDLRLSASPIEFSPSSYPVLGESAGLVVSAGGVAVMDSDSHTIIYSKNPTRYFSPASTAKILTALVALEKFSLEDILTVRSGEIDGSAIGLKRGEKLTFENLLYAMMLPSANDATVAIAENYPAGLDAFVMEMNTKAKESGLLSTHLEDPVGLEDETNFTTPKDLVVLGDIATRNPQLFKIVGTKNKTIRTLDGREFDLSNLNILLGREGIEGIKTGFTETSGQVLATSRKKDGKRIIIVVMQSQDRFGDTLRIIEALDKNLTYVTIAP